MADKGKAALTGAATGAAAGAALGPWGAAGGAVIGGALGYFGADDSEAPKYTPDRRNFEFGLGPSDGYAAEQAGVYNDRADATYGAAFDAQGRAAPQQVMPTRRDFIGSQGQNYLENAGAEARAQQIAALGGIQQANSRLSRFADRPEGPSAAQAMLRQSTGEAIAQQSAFARSQPGGGGAALRNAAFNSAGLQANANAQASQLRANEAAAYRAQQLQALGAVQQGAGMQAGYTGQLRAGDTTLAQSQAGQANYNAQQQNAYNQYQQGMEFQLGANNVNSQLQQGAQNNAYTLGLLSGSQNYGQMSDSLANQQSQMGVAYEQAKAAGAGIGSNNFNAAQDRGLQETGMMLGAVSGGAGAIGQMNGGGQAAGGYNPTSDIRAKKNIRPASVAAALGGKTPAQAWGDYDRARATMGPGGYMTPEQQLADVQDFRARQDFSRDTGEFGQPRTRSAQELGMRRPNLETMRALAGPPREETPLSADEEEAFQYWARRNNVSDANDPRANYDYRGFWKETAGQPVRYGVDHFPDTYKQHGHPTFSVESQYSRGPDDGGRWDGDRYIDLNHAPSQVVQDAMKTFGREEPTPDDVQQVGQILRKKYGADTAAEFEGYTNALIQRKHDTRPAPTDFRPAAPAAYEYKDPERHGHGTFVSPMADDMEHLPGVVERGPDGMKTVNAPRLTLSLAGAMSEQQRQQDADRARLARLEQMAALGGQASPYGAGGFY